jgi:chemotaxis protein histidine kinase CheA
MKNRKLMYSKNNKVNKMNDKRKQLYEELYKEYLELLPEKISSLETYYIEFEETRSETSYSNLVRIVHSIKGSGGSYGHHFLTTLCKEWESKLNGWYNFNDHYKEILELSIKGLDLMRMYSEDPESCEDHLLENFK